ncbi:hypothetical protein BH24ACT21_BH24ACT21_02130 [soil metagenome]|jgi:nitroimidazol reductase NimA-like FMN-containing flavoprotein (pyridoxamine 5'-phosphate oxidase superfamily)
MSWKILEQESPELASFGAERLGGGVAYLATTRADGSPQVHPVTAVIGGGRLFIFMEPTSPKGHDLRRDGRYAMHSTVRDAGGSNGEFLITGRAEFVEDPEVWKLAASFSSYAPAERYVLFELGVESVLAITYDNGLPTSTRWNK